MRDDPLVRGLAATIIVVFILGIIGRAVGVITYPQDGGALVLAAGSYLFGSWMGRNGH